MTLTDDGARTLRAEVLKLAISDYQRWYKKVQKDPNDRLALFEWRKLRRFFTSKAYTLYSDYDGATLLCKLDKLYKIKK